MEFKYLGKSFERMKGKYLNCKWSRLDRNFSKTTFMKKNMELYEPSVILC
jgi:hypothetical protein